MKYETTKSLLYTKAPYGLPSGILIEAGSVFDLLDEVAKPMVDAGELKPFHGEAVHSGEVVTSDAERKRLAKEEQERLARENQERLAKEDLEDGQDDFRKAVDTHHGKKK